MLGITFIVMGLLIARLWAIDVKRGQQNPGKLRRAHLSILINLVIYLLALSLIIIGVVFLII